MEKTLTLENIASKAKSVMAVSAGLVTNIGIGAAIHYAHKNGVPLEKATLLALPGIGIAGATTEMAYLNEGAKRSKGALIGIGIVAPVGQAIGYGLSMLNYL